MAELLYRLGRFSAHHARMVVAAWLAVLALAGGAYLVAGGTLASGFSIPDTPTAEVTARLEAEFPEAAGATGTVVMSTHDGAAFTAEQQTAISELVTQVGRLDGVARVVDPFATEAERAAQAEQITGGRASLEEGRAQLEQASAQVEAGRAQLDAGQAQLDEGQRQLDDAQAQLDAARAQAEAAGMTAQVAPQLDAQQAQLDAQRAQLDAQQDAVDAQRAELDQGAADVETSYATLDREEQRLELGAGLLEMAEQIRQVSQDGSAAVVTVVFDDATFEVPEEVQQSVLDEFRGASIDDVDIDFTSGIAMEVPKILGFGEAVGVLVAAVVLLVMLGTLVAAGLPILTAGIGVAIGALGALAFSGVVDMVSVTPVLGVMLGLAVGIDYSLFILNRHRRQLKQGYDVDESIGLANGTSGNAVVFAGSTVLIALLALNVTGIPFLGLMGTVGAASIAIAVLVAITLTPALLGLLGTRVLRRRERAHLETAPAPATTPLRPMSTGRAIVRALVGVAALGLLALPATSLRIGLPDGSSEAKSSTTYQAYRTIEQKFGAGQNGTLLVIADLPAGADENESLAAQAAVASRLFEVPDVAAVAPVATSQDGSLAAFQVVPEEGPNAESTEALVNDLRDMSPLDGDIPIAVAGQTSGAIDVSAKLAEALPTYLAVVVGLSLIILMLVFRSILVPLIATLGFVLSFFAALGAVVVIYQWGWLGGLFQVHAPGPVLSFLPTVLVGILFGLAMDYQLFLGSGMREAYAHGASPRMAIVQGVRAGRAVVTAAALIMTSVFGGFIFAESTMIRPIGFALAFGVLVDAFVVRMLVVPSLLHLAGDHAWWLPRWLDRLLPDVDVEGAKLERRHPHVEHHEVA
ncbi:MMPL family transporter [Actinotalea fermentans]|uniref:SSD domain-containing protein n=1 Tax=Actinotalea fermentans TaxID=43671 RepID=A0A511Z1N2_9CELL|nr:MMPL family transporter [Actinotalea fermentans]GEN81355.1 hypothetical protein AFE02nite_30890 [Actinotalea fermentans]